MTQESMTEDGLVVEVIVRLLCNRR